MTSSSFPEVGQIIGAKWELWLLPHIGDDALVRGFKMMRVPADSKMLVISKGDHSWHQVLDITTGTTGWLELNDYIGVYLYCQKP